VIYSGSVETPVFVSLGEWAHEYAFSSRHLNRCHGGAYLPHHQGAERILMVTQEKIRDITVDVLLKDIKNVHLGVYSPTGRVRISAPLRMSLDTIREVSRGLACGAFPVAA
jgi:hypothetical protein